MGPLAVLLAKGKFLLSTVLKLKFLLSFVAFFGFYWAVFGMRFGLGFAGLILIHEMGHYIDIRRRGLFADMPVFSPRFGRLRALASFGSSDRDPRLHQPRRTVHGFLASVACALIWHQTHDSIWAALAYAGAWLNLLNLIPIWMLDGGHAALALGKTGRFILLVASLGLWLVLKEKLFLWLAVGAAYQAFFAGDLPARPSRTATAYFIAVLTGLGIIMRLLPGQGFGPR